jgi:Domain of unknown function (DUF4919)
VNFAYLPDASCGGPVPVDLVSFSRDADNRSKVPFALDKRFIPRTVLTICLLLLAVPLFAFTQSKENSPDNYQALVERVKKGDQTVNFRDLRIAYSDSPAFTKGPDTSDQRQAMRQALNSKDFAKAIQNADVVLASNYVDMDAHFVEYVAYSELKNPERAAFHKFILQSLLKSITASGDGKTPETAYQVIDVDEEYVLLRIMGVGLPKKQSYMHKDGHYYDALTLNDPSSKEERVIYFNVDIPAKHGL